MVGARHSYALAELAQDFRDTTAPLAVIGLGYVGVALAATLAEAGFAVVGVDHDAERVTTLRAGTLPFVGDEPALGPMLHAALHAEKLRITTSMAHVGAAAAVFVCVETPVDADHRPGYHALRAVLAELGPVLAQGALVVVESTLAPGTMRTLVIPALEAASGGRVGERFHVGHCPERVMSGRLVHNLRAMNRVCGASSPEVGTAMLALYRTIVRGELDVTDLDTAELVKTAENAYRDVAIAFANELALICEQAGADFLEVRRLVNKSPGREVLFAGAGVGGHCIPKDSWLLAAGAPSVEPWLLTSARRRNDGMPAHVLARTEAALGRSLDGARLAVLGFAFREDGGDVRESPSARLVALAQAAGAEVCVHDPFVADFAHDRVEAIVDGADALVVLVAHSAYRELDLASLAGSMRAPVLVDARNVFAAEAAIAAGFRYHRVGLGGAARAAAPKEQRP